MLIGFALLRPLLVVASPSAMAQGNSANAKARREGGWDTEPRTDCCPVACESFGREAMEAGIFIPEKDCCTKAG